MKLSLVASLLFARNQKLPLVLSFSCWPIFFQVMLGVTYNLWDYWCKISTGQIPFQHPTNSIKTQNEAKN